MRIVAIILGVLIAGLAQAQTVLPPGTYIVPACGATSTSTATPVPTVAPTPVATPTTVPAVGSFISSSFALLYCSNPTQLNCITLFPNQDNSQYTWWSVQPFDGHRYPTTIASVDVFQNGVRLPNTAVAGSPHTWVYRIGGQPVGQIYSSGVTKIPLPPSTQPGTMQTKYVAYDDNGNIVQSITTPITLRNP